MATERDPLIPNGSNLIQDHRPPGPRDISRSTRYGILVGLWSATFLSVSFYHLTAGFSDWLQVFE